MLAERVTLREYNHYSQATGACLRGHTRANRRAIATSYMQFGPG